MKATIRYYFNFGSRFSSQHLFSPDAWDELRFSGGTAYTIAADRGAWLTNCAEHVQAIEGALTVGKIAKNLGCEVIFSAGVGRACLEYHIKQQYPEIDVVCTEYSMRMVEMLRSVFFECDEIFHFDMTNDPWPRPERKTLYLLYRVDTGLTDQEWRLVYARMAASGIGPILVVATEFLTPRSLLRQCYYHARSFVLRRRLTFSGFLRTRSAFKDLWSPYYISRGEHIVGGLRAFLLQRA